MTAEEIEKAYITFAAIARECGVERVTVFSWANYHGYFPKEKILGKVVTPRDAFERFKEQHPNSSNHRLLYESQPQLIKVLNVH